MIPGGEWFPEPATNVELSPFLLSEKTPERAPSMATDTDSEGLLPTSLNESRSYYNLRLGSPTMSPTGSPIMKNAGSPMGIVHPDNEALHTTHKAMFQSPSLEPLPILPHRQKGYKVKSVTTNAVQLSPVLPCQRQDPQRPCVNPRARGSQRANRTGWSKTQPATGHPNNKVPFIYQQGSIPVPARFDIHQSPISELPKLPTRFDSI